MTTQIEVCTIESKNGVVKREDICLKDSLYTGGTERFLNNMRMGRFCIYIQNDKLHYTRESTALLKHLKVINRVPDADLREVFLTKQEYETAVRLAQIPE